MATQPTDAEILAAKLQNPDMGKRKLARLLLPPGTEDERAIGKMSSRVARVLRRNLPKQRQPEPPAVVAPPQPMQTGRNDGRPMRLSDKMRADLNELTATIPLMKASKSWQAYVRACREVWNMRLDLQLQEAKEGAVDLDDVTDERVLKLLLKMPLATLQAAVTKKLAGGWG